jgi:retron-type reverse transcriptase
MSIVDQEHRKAIYAAMRRSSKREYIRAEMVRLGFWPEDAPAPTTPQEVTQRRSEIHAEIQRLRAQSRQLHNERRLRREALRARLAASCERRAETIERQLARRRERAAAWRERKKREILYLGEGVSGGLGRREHEPQKLFKAGLPVLSDAETLARAMGTSVGELRFLAFARKVSTVGHYRTFRIAKKRGGHRVISAPMPRLKAAQHWILGHVLEKVPPHEAAHGFRKGRDVVTNARPHVGADVVINMDLKDFFPTITYRRVKGMFKGMGYSEEVATIFGLLCSAQTTREVKIDGRSWHVGEGERRAPQGAPTSPAIANLLCRKLDARLDGLARAMGYTYTRYADDLTFSGSGERARDGVGALLGAARRVVADEGFVVHPEKTRVMRKGSRQEVTGVVVNARPTVERKMVRRLRAVIRQIELDGPAGKTWGESADVVAGVCGYAAWVKMVDPERGTELLARAQALRARYGAASAALSGAPLEVGELPGAAAGEGDEDWWKVW